jgi:hypothetical protein
MKTKSITQTRLRELFHYDNRRGALIWKKSRGGKAIIGSVAGRLHKSDGYIKIKVDRVEYQAHRLIWLWHYGHLPEMLDHRDNVRTNNHIVNLRPATYELNRANSKISRNNRSGFKGVCVKRDKFEARIRHNGISVYLGLFKTAQEAYGEYCLASNKYFGEYARAA